MFLTSSIRQLLLHHLYYHLLQGLYVVQEYTPDFIFDYVDGVHEQSQELSTGATANKTENQIIQ